MCFTLLGCGDEEGAFPTTEQELTFERRVVDGAIAGPAFAAAADLNGDGRLDLVVSAFGRVEGFTLPTGTLTAYLQGEDLTSWERLEIVAEEHGLYWPNAITAHDIDGDGDTDLALGVGFLVCAIFPEPGPCGGLLWLEQDGDEWLRHDVVEPTTDLFYHHVELADIDADGRLDMVSVGESRVLVDGARVDRAEAHWFRGVAGAQRFEGTPRVIGDGLGSIPSARDIDGDGDLDVASAEFFAGRGASFVWYEQLEAPSPEEPAGVWRRHVIDDQVGPSIQLSFAIGLEGVTGLAAIGSNHDVRSTRPVGVGCLPLRGALRSHGALAQNSHLGAHHVGRRHSVVPPGRPGHLRVG